MFCPTHQFETRTFSQPNIELKCGQDKNTKNLDKNTENIDIKYNSNHSNNSNNYMIYLFNLLIGKIVYNNEKKIYKIMCYQEYKTYLNLFGIGLIFLITN